MAIPVPTAPPRMFSGPDESDLYKCVHCGFCLQECPTYLETGLETESPRGRIALMKAVNEGRIDIGPTVVRHWDRCIQCQACEVACPSGIPYGQLIEATMAFIGTRRKLGLLPRLVSGLALRQILPHQERLALLVSALRLYQWSGLQHVLRKTRLLQLMSSRLGQLERYLPAIRSAPFKARGQSIPAKGQKRARVALLSGCVMPLANGPEMNAVVRVLTRNGCEVVVPRGQVCCGAISSHVGDLDTARDLARRNIDVFLACGVDAVVVAAAGCGSRMKEYGHLLRDDPEYAEKAGRFSEMVKDIHEFLVELPFEPPKARLDYRVTYQDSCRLGRHLGIYDPPRQVLAATPGVELVEMRRAKASAMCCAGGTWSNCDRFSKQIQVARLREARATEAEVLATACPKCQVHFRCAMQDAKLEGEIKIEMRDVAELVADALKQG